MGTMFLADVGTAAVGGGGYAPVVMAPAGGFGGAMPAIIGAPGRRLLQKTSYGWTMHATAGGRINPVWSPSTLGVDLAPGEWNGSPSTTKENCAVRAAQNGVPFFAWSPVHAGYCKTLKPGIVAPNLATNLEPHYGYSLYEPTYGLVNCKLFIDDWSISVKYNGEQLPVSGTGGWDQVKTFSYIRKPGAVLEIVGQEHDNIQGHGCSISGMLLECDSGLTSNTHDWHTHGSQDGVNWVPSSHVCQSTSGFHSSGQTPNAQKIWSGNGLRYAKFMTIPIYHNHIEFRGSSGARAILLLSEYIGYVVHKMGQFINGVMRLAGALGLLIPGIVPPGLPIALPSVPSLIPGGGLLPGLGGIFG